ncbi:MAG: ParA family protein [Candidatus Obscuribacterales bacterium]|jgi:chromosome partitioning protein|nr:ParA family protein [Candidatus Obscuribacterales bacterium]
MIITVASFKGGVGKTTTAFHIAAFLNERGKTLLVDGDPNRSVMKWAERGDVPFKVVDLMGAAMHAPNFEHIVFDTEARPEYEDLKALSDGCHLLVLPTTPDVLSLEALMLTVKALRDAKSTKFKVLLTIVPPRPERDGQEARQYLHAEGLPVFKSEIRRFAAYKKAALTGIPVHEIKAGNAKEAWEDYRNVGEEIVNEHQQVFAGIATSQTSTVATR